MMLLIASLFYYHTFKTALLERTLEQLSSINMLKRIQIEEYLAKNTNISIADPQIKFILRENTGIGQTGESYLIDQTLRMRSQSRFFPEKNPLEILVNTESAQLILQYGESKLLCPDYRQVPVLSVGRWVTKQGERIAILTEIDESEAMKPVYKIRDFIVIYVVSSSILITIITLLLAGKLSKPILQLKSMIESLALGKIPDEKVAAMDFKELEEIHQALEKLKDEFLNTSHFAKETGNGNFEANFSPLSQDDILGHALIQMRDKLKSLTESQLLMQRQRASALLEGQEKEREFISRELHDGVGQLLTGIKLMLESEKIHFEKKDQIKELLSETIMEVRRISQSAMPPALAGLGLEAALNNLRRIMSAKNTVKIELEYELSPTFKGDFETNICLYRICQEALNNMVKYSEATRCLIHLWRDEKLIRMTIADNGKGFDKPSKILNGNGLRNMKERAAMLQGACRIVTSEGKGTTVHVEIPFSHTLN
jgi:signal transduction histidine kinase